MPVAFPSDALSAAASPPAVLRRLVLDGVIPADGWDAVSPAERAALAAVPDLAALANALAGRRLLTPFQADRVRAGGVAGLVLGNYRLLDPLVPGTAGPVFRGEHQTLRTPVAVKVLPPAPRTRAVLERFFLEVRAVAALRHPTIVAATDAGEQPGVGPDGEAVPYLVMDLIPGRTLEEWVGRDGPLPVARACQLAHQLADALTEAHRYGLVHWGIKPANVLVTPEGQPRLLNFGAAWLTAPGPAPRDLGARSDVFGLAATLFYALTGEHLTPSRRAAARAVRPDLPAELDAALAHMLAPDPAARTPSAAAVMRELAPFLGYAQVDLSARTPAPAGSSALSPPSSSHSGERLPRTYRVLVVDDEEPIRRVCRLALQNEPVTCDEAATGPEAVAKGLAQGYDLVLLDVDLPGLSGEMVLRKLRQQPPAPHLKVVMLSGRTSGDDLSRLLNTGADDYLTKPFSVVQLRSRVKAALRLKDAQDRSDRLATRLATANADLERALTARDGELIHARGAMVLALAKLVEARSSETGAHLLRLQRYCRVLAEAAAATPAFADRLDPAFVQAVEAAAPLHDIGKVAIPDHVLNKPGRLTPEERAVMQTHTTAGADTLAEVSARYPFASGFFHTAVEIARHHHERWDGTGYPDRLAGEAIPLAARLVAVADVYDALRSRRVYKPGFPHELAAETMVMKSPGHFDPALLGVFRQVAPQFERIYREAAD